MGGKKKYKPKPKLKLKILPSNKFKCLKCGQQSMMVGKQRMKVRVTKGPDKGKVIIKEVPTLTCDECGEHFKFKGSHQVTATITGQKTRPPGLTAPISTPKGILEPIDVYGQYVSERLKNVKPEPKPSNIGKALPVKSSKIGSDVFSKIESLAAMQGYLTTSDIGDIVKNYNLIKQIEGMSKVKPINTSDIFWIKPPPKAKRVKSKYTKRQRERLKRKHIQRERRMTNLWSVINQPAQPTGKVYLRVKNKKGQIELVPIRKGQYAAPPTVATQPSATLTPEQSVQFQKIAENYQKGLMKATRSNVPSSWMKMLYSDWE